MSYIKKNIKLIAVSVGHFTNDFYMNLIPPILFIFSEEMGLTLAQQSFVAFVITVGGSLLQPAIGYFLDKIKKTEILIYGIVWIAIGMSITGFINNYYMLVIVSGLAAIASSVYHPLGSAIAINLSEGSSGKSLSIFMTIGGFAATFTPLISVPLVTKYGLNSLIILIIPGLLVAYFLASVKIHKFKYKPIDKIEKNKKKEKTKKYNLTWLSLVVIIAIIKIALSRVILVFGVQILNMKGIDLIFAGIILSIHLFMRTIGTLTGGFFSDKFGEKRIMIFFNVLTLVTYLVVSFTTGLIAAISFIILGYTLNATTTANITIVHKIVPENINFGTGMIMGFASTVAGIGMLLFGKIADVMGLIDTTQMFNVFIFIIIIISILLPKQFSDAHYLNKNIG